MSEVEYPCASFRLRMMDLPNTSSSVDPAYNNVGWSLSRKDICGWTSISLREIIGSSYDKFELFNIVLTSVTSSATGNAGSNANSRLLQIFMSGLNWVNQGYDSKTKSISNNILIGFVCYVQNSGVFPNGANNGYICPMPCTFSKSSSNPDIIITLGTLGSGALPPMGTDPFNFQFNFDIYGISDDNLSH